MGRRSLFSRSRLARIPVALCLLSVTVGACAPSTPSAPAGDRAIAVDAGFLNQWRPGKDARELARTWYLTPQGSYLLDFDVFMSIPSASDDALFSSRANLESYGFLYSDNYEEGGTRQEEHPNAGALPIGVVKDT